MIQTTGKVYITNNITNSNNDWGGGGIFVQENGILTIMDALITGNTAGGFGGGVGACPTGKTLIVNQDGAAIYGNTAFGANMSDGGNGKEYDTTVAKASTVFMENGYTDYFCVRKKDGANDPISLVTGLMAGGGAANWTGSLSVSARAATRPRNICSDWMRTRMMPPRARQSMPRRS